MSQDAAFYRTGLIESIILLLLLLLAFGALTVMMRERWLALGATESLLARLAASAVVASVAVGGLSGVVLNLLQGSAFSDTTLSAAASRNQALLQAGPQVRLRLLIGMLRTPQLLQSIASACACCFPSMEAAVSRSHSHPAYRIPATTAGLETCALRSSNVRDRTHIISEGLRNL